MRDLDLHPWITAEIMEINAAELEEVSTQTDLQGFIANHSGLMWRRAIRRNHLASYLGFEGESDDDPGDAWNYVSIYRWATNAEMTNYELEGDTLLVVSVMSNLELAQFINFDSPY
jgi:hypothetical protein